MTKSTSPILSEPSECPSGISGSVLKLIAVISMLLDHIGAAVLYRLILHNGYTSANRDVWIKEHFTLYYGYYAARMVGRIAFPIFCFLLVEGFTHTHSRKKYALRLFIFALISEIPFDLAFQGRRFYRGYQNVFFTLLIGLLLLCVFSYIEKHPQTSVSGIAAWVLGIALAAWYGPRFAEWPAHALLHMVTEKSFNETILHTALSIAFAVLTAAAAVYISYTEDIPRSQIFCAKVSALCLAAALADALKTDYSGAGIVAIALIYLLRKNRSNSMIAACLLLAVKNSFEIPAFISIAPIAKYNGKRGFPLKYAFYVFYPAHLLILYLICAAAGIL